LTAVAAASTLRGMTSNCPKCKSATLHHLSMLKRPAGDPEAVVPSRCGTCQGVWLPHEAIVLELKPSDSAEGDAPSPGSPTNLRPGMCPMGHGLLSRARTEGSPSFHLDRCEACRGIWFDAGEWAAIAATEWLHHLDDLWDPVHRKQMREQTEREHRLATLKTALGEEAYQKVLAAADALRDHPQSSIALAFLLDEARHHSKRA
jgi:Zn-finger nucleic acid-binding protein